ncbi:beta-propeller fold lactonase family protein [Parasphingorhabdus sp.]|uniref:beta-propeller fold lactonase family protein n=1 Tax=Parasphingorhabdus sp. TaxID=2709688 RepID=UPI003C759497
MIGKYARASSAILLLAACSISSENVAAESDPLSGTLLVGNKGENSLSFIDLESGEETARRDTGNQPHEIAISPDGQLAAIVSYGGESIDIFDIAAMDKIETVSLAPARRPHGILWLEDGRIIATTEGSDNVTVVSAPTGETQQRQIAMIATGQKGSHMLAVTPDRSRAFVANMQSGTVSVLDLNKLIKITDLPAGTVPEGLAITPDGKTVWVADRSGDMIRVFDAESLQELAAIKTGKFPIRVAISPDGKTAVTSDLGDGALGLFDVATREPAGKITVSGSADSRQVTILFSPDGKMLYVAETGPDMIAEVDMTAGKVVRRFKAGADGDGLGIVIDSVAAKK